MVVGHLHPKDHAVELHAIELDHRTTADLQQVADLHFRGAEHGGDIDADILDRACDIVSKRPAEGFGFAAAASAASAASNRGFDRSGSGLLGSRPELRGVFRVGSR